MTAGSHAADEKPLPIIVLGAGCAGLAAAWRLVERGQRVLVIEAQDTVGGLAGGVHAGGDLYEYGPHVFHTQDPDILADIKSLMGADLQPYKRTIQIKFMGGYFRFPLRLTDILGQLPIKTILAATAAYAWRSLEGLVRRPTLENSETVLVRSYGDVLYRLFFRDYITRVWGIPPAEFSPAFARERIPRLNILEVFEKAAAALRRRLGRRPREGSATQGYVEKVTGDLHTTREGFHLIVERMAARLRAVGAQIRLGARVERLEREGSRITAVVVRSGDREESLPCAGIVNTLPLDEAARAITPGLGPEIESAAAALRFRAIVFVGLKVRRPRVLPASFMYFREHSFNRITDFSYFGFHIDPPGFTLLVAEITCAPADRIWTDDQLARELVLGDLRREGILAPDEVEATHVFRARHAHPIYTLGYEKSRQALLDAFTHLRNAETAGRQGRFQYVNTHVAIKMGQEAADRLCEKFPG